MAYVCPNGHMVQGNNAGCSQLGCPYYVDSGGGVDPRAYFSVVLAVIAGPLYPIAGGLGWLSVIPVHYLCSWIGFADGIRLILMIATAVAVFWRMLKFEIIASRSRAYRIARDILRFWVPLTVQVLALANTSSRDVSGADALGLLLLLPVLFAVVKRIDRVIGVAAPEGERSSGWVPDRVRDYFESSNLPAASLSGLFGFFLGFALGRQEGLLAGLLLGMLLFGIVMLVSGGRSR